MGSYGPLVANYLFWYQGLLIMDKNMHYKGRVPELDGLRGLAVLSVIVAHYFGKVPGVGVDVFFVLSGYLIGGILLDQRESANLLTVFYVRRAFRIFPIYYLTLMLVLFFAATHKNSWIDPPYPAAVYFTYVQNVWMTVVGGQLNIWLLPTWTLAVEEQFYLLLPFIIARAPARWLFPIIIAAIVSAPMLRGFILTTHFIPSVGAVVLLPCRWDLLFLGVLAAYVMRSPRLWERIRADRGRLMLRLVVLASPCLMFGSVLLGFDPMGPLWHFALGLCAASYLLLVSMDGSEGHFLCAPWLRFFGAISYGLYLIHQPIAGLMHGLLLDARPGITTVVSFLVTVMAFVLSVGISWLSWVWIEGPLVRLGHRWIYQRSTVDQASAVQVTLARA
jgi:peptidoglycan/LPS O-acetylase OafA/YrhL